MSKVTSLACSNCDELVIKSLDGIVKIRAKVVLVKPAGVVAVCKGCDTEIPIPLALDEDLAKAQAASPRLYLKKR